MAQSPGPEHRWDLKAQIRREKRLPGPARDLKSLITHLLVEMKGYSQALKVQLRKDTPRMIVWGTVTDDIVLVLKENQYRIEKQIYEAPLRES